MEGAYQTRGRREFAPTKWALRQDTVVEGVLLEGFSTRYGLAVKVRVTEPCEYSQKDGDSYSSEIAEPGDEVCVRTSAMNKQGLEDALKDIGHGQMVGVKITFRGRTMTKSGQETIDSDVASFVFDATNYEKVTGLRLYDTPSQVDNVPIT